MADIAGNALKIEKLSKSYGTLKVLDEIDVEVKKGERVALLGPSGCGKTTILKIVAGLTRPDGGNILLEVLKIGFVFQEDRLIPWKTVCGNLEFVSSDTHKVEKVLKLVRLWDYRNFYPLQLSGGMKQRVNLARALLVEPDLLLLDEPFKGLDLEIKAELMNEILRMCRSMSITALLVTHDLREALIFADRIYVLSPAPARVKNVLEIDLPSEHRDFCDTKLLDKEKEVLSQGFWLPFGLPESPLRSK